jgi:hypothetical protein
MRMAKPSALGLSPPPSPKTAALAAWSLQRAGKRKLRPLREGVLPNYVRRLTRLAFLAPRIVEAIVAGHQPPELTAKALTERRELPLLWSEQEYAVGID